MEINYKLFDDIGYYCLGALCFVNAVWCISLFIDFGRTYFLVTITGPLDFAFLFMIIMVWAVIPEWYDTPWDEYKQRYHELMAEARAWTKRKR